MEEEGKLGTLSVASFLPLSSSLFDRNSQNPGVVTAAVVTNRLALLELEEEPCDEENLLLGCSKIGEDIRVRRARTRVVPSDIMLMNTRREVIKSQSGVLCVGVVAGVEGS